MQHRNLIYYLLNKPAGCVSATEDRNDRTVMEYVPSDRKGLFPVGRLDKDTEGLLLITDDGMLAHELLAPGKHVDKTYFVRVEGKLTVEKIKKLENGVDIGEKKLTMPAKVEIVGGSWEGAGEPEPGRVRRENLPEVYTELHLTIHEGKFHQVKRMMAAVETPVIYLKRITMGSLTLPDDLRKGEYRALTDEELKNLRKVNKNSQNPLYTEGFLMLYSRSCNVRKTAQIKITYRDSDGWCPYGVRLGPDRK